jgi:hypothetical protein
MDEQVVQEVAEPRFHDLMELFEELSFKEKWKRVSEGLKMPKDSGEYKWARLQMIRLSAPAAAVVLPCILIMIIALLAAIKPPPAPPVQVQIIEPEEVEELEDIKEEIIEPPEPPEPEEVEPTDIISDSPYAGADPTATPGPVADFSPQPTTFDAVAIVKSPVVMRGIYGSRSPGARGAALAGGGGGSATEAAVLRALRWMKKNQASEGYWGVTKPAMTSLALLAYLAHGETPSSEEFGLTVEMAIKYLLECAGDGSKFKGADGHEYTHPIATYALCEAYGMTQVPDIKYVAQKALERIIKGQHATGGWNYNLDQSARDDTSYMGWCAQALKAGKAAGIEAEGLEEACKKSIEGFKKNFAGNYDGGGFGYIGPSKDHGLSPVGTLCMQLHGAGNADEVIGSLKSYDQVAKWQTYDIDNPAPGKDGLYYWYYLTQVKFHAGGETWNKWNKLFSPELVNKQTVIAKEQSGYTDHKGEPRSIGYWGQYGGHGSNEGDIFSTCLATLQLEVYYRYLPTFKLDGAEAPVDVNAPQKDANNDVKIDISI